MSREGGPVHNDYRQHSSQEAVDCRGCANRVVSVVHACTAEDVAADARHYVDEAGGHKADHSLEHAAEDHLGDHVHCVVVEANVQKHSCDQAPYLEILYDLGRILVELVEQQRVHAKEVLLIDSTGLPERANEADYEGGSVDERDQDYE